MKHRQLVRQVGDLARLRSIPPSILRMAFTTVSWLPGTMVCFGTHRFVIITDGSTEWVQPVASPLLPPVAGAIDAAGPWSTELGGSL